MKIYCQKCGTGMEYTYEKPNFCTKCGSSFNPVKSTVAKTIPARSREITQEDDTEDIESLENIKNMSQLDVEISAISDRKAKIKDIVGTRSDDFSNENQPQVPINKKDIMESFKKEAGFYPSRNEIDEEK